MRSKGATGRELLPCASQSSAAAAFAEPSHADTFGFTQTHTHTLTHTLSLTHTHSDVLQAP